MDAVSTFLREQRLAGPFLSFLSRLVAPIAVEKQSNTRGKKRGRPSALEKGEWEQPKQEKRGKKVKGMEIE